MCDPSECLIESGRVCITGQREGDWFSQQPFCYYGSVWMLVNPSSEIIIAYLISLKAGKTNKWVEHLWLFTNFLHHLNCILELATVILVQFRPIFFFFLLDCDTRFSLIFTRLSLSIKFLAQGNNYISRKDQKGLKPLTSLKQIKCSKH